MTEVAVESAAQWEAWLDEHHESESEVWLVYWKKASGRPSVALGDLVEVALKFGWIDGRVQRLDEQRYRQRWTPRRPRSTWTRGNREIALRHIAAGEMRRLGLAAVEAAKASGQWDSA